MFHRSNQGGLIILKNNEKNFLEVWARPFTPKMVLKLRARFRYNNILYKQSCELLAPSDSVFPIVVWRNANLGTPCICKKYTIINQLKDFFNHNTHAEWLLLYTYTLYSAYVSFFFLLKKYYEQKPFCESTLQTPCNLNNPMKGLLRK